MAVSILVTGASGCIGRSLCRALLCRGYHVAAFVRSRESAARLPGEVEVRWIGDIGPTTTWPVGTFAKFDAVIHLAAKVHAQRVGDASGTYQQVNAEATENLARMVAAQSGDSRFVFCSSAHAVCNFAANVVDESSPCAPQTPYGMSKREAERRLGIVAAETGLSTVVLRPAPVYGPELPGDLMKLLRMVSRGWPLPLGAVDNRRSLVYVENVVDALIAAATHPAASGETFFVSDGEEVSLSSLLSMYSAMSGRRSRLIAVSPGNIRRFLSLLGKSSTAERMLGSLAIDSRRIRRTLSWQPPFDLTQGLSATAQWMNRVA